MKSKHECDAKQFTAAVIGKQLKTMRVGASLSQAQVAKRAKTRPEILSRIECGRGNPTVRLVERIVKAIEALAS